MKRVFLTEMGLLLFCLCMFGTNVLWAEVGTTKWVFPTGGAVATSPAIGSSGTIYIGSHDKKIYAINPDGTEKWSFTTNGYARSSPAIGSDGTIYAGSEDHKLYAINPDGTLKWSFTTGDWVVSSPAIAIDGTIYVGSHDGYVYAINPDGTEKWSFQTQNWVVSSPAIGCDGTIYVGSEDDNLYALDPDDGAQLWTFSTAGDVSSSPAIALDGTIYVESFDGYLYAINPDGSQKWRIQVGDGGHSCPTIGPDGTIFVGSYYVGKLYAINPEGTLEWSFDLGGQVASAAIGSDGVVYIGSKAGVFYALDPEGNQLWSFPSGQVYMTSATIGDEGVIYVGSHTNDCLYALYSNSTGPAESAWPTFHHDVEHTGRYSPSMSLSFSPDILWPPNRKMVQIFPIIMYNSYCNSKFNFQVLSIAITDGNITCTYDPQYEYSQNDCYSYNDYKIDENGNLYLRAIKSKIGDSRIYTITFKVVDEFGNNSVATSYVTVPHDMR